MSNLNSCRDCGNSISRSAKFCPRCGAPAPRRTSLVAATVGGFFLIMVVWAIVDTATPIGASATQTVSAKVSIRAGDILVIKNENDFDWPSATVHLNGIVLGYECEIGPVLSGKEAVVRLTSFAKGNGERFLPTVRKPTEVVIAVPGCDSPVYKF